MRVLNFRITLLDDVVLSAQSATVEHHTLDYIPGAVVLGAAAARLYSQLDMSQSFSLFHSGQVRFGNAYIENALPVPLSWHVAKGSTFSVDGGMIDRSKVKDMAYRQASEFKNRQPQQLRQGYLDASYRLLYPKTGFRLKTAIDPDSGRAEESQLYGYQHLCKDQVFEGQIILDDDLDETLIKQLQSALQGKLYLGRSRASQYGMAHFEWLSEREVGAFSTCAEHALSPRHISIWCLSDCCLYDEKTGQPVLQLQPHHLGLSGSIDTAHTFIRTRKYIPYNTYRKGFEIERPVISKGSIITFLLDSEVDREKLLEVMYQGVGLYQEQGLGTIAINHPWLSENYQPVVLETADSKPQDVQVPETVLGRWLVSQDDSEERLQPYINDMLASLRQFYWQGRAYHAVQRQQLFGLSTTQWGHLYDLAKSSRRLTDLKHHLFEAADALCKASHNEDWHRECNAQGDSFTDWLRQQIARLASKNTLDDHDISIIVTRFAKQCRIYNDQWLRGIGLNDGSSQREDTAGGAV